MEVNDPSVLSETMNITSAGKIPAGPPQTWTVTFHCAPYDAETDVMIRVSVFATPKNKTILEFKRRKICLVNKTLELENKRQEVLVAASGTNAGGQVFYAAIGCACAFVSAICVLVVAYYVRDKKSRRHRDPLQ